MSARRGAAANALVGAAYEVGALRGFLSGAGLMFEAERVTLAFHAKTIFFA